MPKTHEDLEKDALSLPKPERALLIEHLLASLDTGEDEEVEELWLTEAEGRYQQYRLGKLAGRPAAAVFEDAPKRLK